MMRAFLCIVLLCCCHAITKGQVKQQLKWGELPLLPSGVTAGHVGVSNGVLVDIDSLGNIFLLSDRGVWEAAPEKLPDVVSAVVSHRERMIVIGRKVYALVVRSGHVRVDSLSALPFVGANAAAGMVGDVAAGVTGDVLYVADLRGRGFYSLDLGVRGEWVKLEAWPGPAREGAVCAVLDGDFFLFGEGRRDAYRYKGGKWVKLADMPGPLRGPVVTMGLDHILFPGAVGRLDMTVYNAAADKWILGEGVVQGEGAAVKWGDDWVVVCGGEIGVLSKDLHFGWLNWLTLAAYLAAMVWVGFIYEKRGQSTDNFFTAGGRIPWWAAGISIYGSQISAITFMAVPAVVFATDWSLLIGSLVLFAIVPIVTKYYIPFFRRLSVTSAYEYLEHRFSPGIRLAGSLSFILFQMGRMGIVLYLPATAIASVTGINIYFLIVVMGVICILYTVMGGIEAVVWTDVAQVIILLGGAMLCFFTAIFHTEGGFHHVLARGLADGKLALYHPGWGADSLTLWVCIVGFFFLNLIPYSSDQTVVQRYLTVKDERHAAKSLWVNALVSLPGTFIFFSLGTVLYVFYRSNPGIIASEKVGEILPYFVVQQLPAGLSGLVIAGVFAASQSTLSASMNSISATFFSDIYQRWNKGADERKTLKVARIVTVSAGVFGAASAMSIAYLHIEFIFDLFQEVLGILGGSLAGVFILGIFTRRANASGAIWGIVVGVATVWILRERTNVSLYLYGAVSVVSCVVAGYAASLLSGEKKVYKSIYHE